MATLLYEIDKIILEELKGKNIPMQRKESNSEIIYQGRLSLSNYPLIDFALFLGEISESDLVCQIAYENIASCQSESQLEMLYSFINDLNLNYALYYYFALDKNNKLFMRHVSKISNPNTVSDIIEILLSGGKIVQGNIQKN